MAEPLTVYVVVCADETRHPGTMEDDLALAVAKCEALDRRQPCGPHRVVAMVPAEAVRGLVVATDDVVAANYMNVESKFYAVPLHAMDALKIALSALPAALRETS